MGATAVIAAVAAVGAAASTSESQQTRRIGQQRANAQKIDTETNNRRLQESEAQEENRAFSKIQRQRQRAMAGNTKAPVSGSSSLGGGSMVTSGGAAVGGPGGGSANKTLLGQ